MNRQMRTLLTSALCALALVIAGCNDSPTSTTVTKIGTSSIEEIQAVPAYKAWFDIGYNGYPLAVDSSAFDAAVSTIKAEFNPDEHMVVMVVKPNCGCQITQVWMPRVAKTLDAAGIPHANVLVFVTDSRLTGVDTLNTRFNTKITTAPVFMIVRKNAVMDNIDPVTLPANRPIEQEIAAGFGKQ
ncbi:MAG TPA: hypothetical protein VHI13_08450 [Candidatus Kapabacteria bacterium]|nr:hypothetical protein [Candidatus Kapabacteria bacterium]